jgi:hypothetical protein
LPFPETKGRTLEEAREIFDGKVEEALVAKEEKGMEEVEVSE